MQGYGWSKDHQVGGGFAPGPAGGGGGGGDLQVLLAVGAYSMG